jgi:hypothetical protein
VKLALECFDVLNFALASIGKGVETAIVTLGIAIGNVDIEEQKRAFLITF